MSEARVYDRNGYLLLPGDFVRAGPRSEKVHLLKRQGDHHRLLQSVCGQVINLGSSRYYTEAVFTSGPSTCLHCLEWGESTRGDTPVSFQCSEQLKSDLQELSEIRGISQSELMRRLIRDAADCEGL